MGKRGRRKQREGTFVERPTAPPRASQRSPMDFPDADVLLDAFWDAHDEQQFERALAEHPALLSPDYERALARMTSGDTGFEPLIDLQVEVLAMARSDVGEAWAKLSEFKAKTEQAGDELEHLMNVRGTMDAEELLDAVDRLAPQAQAAGMMIDFGRLQGLRGEALLRLPTIERAQAVDEALECLERSGEYAETADEALERTMQIGLALAERLHDDRAENVEAAVGVLHEAVQSISTETDPDLAATVRTNLATALLRRERGDRQENLQEARKACLEALKHRSPSRDPYDWAHSELNLAEVLRYIAVNRGEPTNESAEAYNRVIEAEDVIEEKWLVGAAHFGLGELETAKGTLTTEEQVDAYAAGQSDEDLEKQQRQHDLAALPHLETATELLANAPDRVYYGRALSTLADVQERLGNLDAALATTAAASEILRPTVAPNPAVGAASRLASLHAQAERWPDAARAYRDALEASELIFQSRLETSDREQESRRAAALARWGAFAMAKSGDGLGAALALDTGRARELRRRTGADENDLDAMDDVPEELVEAYRAAATRLRGSPLVTDGHDAGRDFQEVVTAIRSVSGNESFGAGATEADLLRATADGWPLVYVNPTPGGTMLTVVERDGQAVRARTRCMDSPTAIQVFLFLMAGAAGLTGDFDESDPPPPSYWAAVTGHSNADALQAALDEVLPWLGQYIARPLAELLEEGEYEGVTLIPCGPISAAPIHACSWTEGSDSRCLLDRWTVRYAPSGPLAAAAVTRAAAVAEREPALVAVANPEENLGAAEPELAEISRHFGDRIEAAVRGQAVASFLRAHAKHATHLHLACHASGSMFDLADSGVHLADGFLPATDFTDLGALETRLVSVSACQSAITVMGDGSEELISIGTAAIAAGSACAIASLWPVDDLASALLLTRTYEVLFAESVSPPEALRQAALWLRDLTTEQEEAFLDAYPTLRAEAQRERAEGEPSRHRRGTAVGGSDYAHPDFWAAFVAVGA